jgi:hypothetical protein
MPEVFDFEEHAAPLRAQAGERMPGPMLEATDRLVAALERSHVPLILREGETAPDFALPVAGSGEVRRLAEMRAQGPVVLSFYRGQW